MRKIAVTGLRGIPNIMGGVEAHCQDLYPRLLALEPDMDITIYGRAPYLEHNMFTFHGVKIRAVPSPTHVSLEAILGTAIAIGAAWVDRADILHIHAIGPSLLAPLGRLLGFEVIVTHHGKDYDRAKWNKFARAMLRLGERAAMRFANQVIAVSPSLAEDLKHRFPAQAPKVTHIPNGVTSLPKATPSVLKEFDLTPGTYIMTAARIVPEKGIHDLITAHLASGAPHKLVIAGDADHDSDYVRSLKQRADETVLFIGKRSRADLRALYENTALFALPSYHEGLPIAALEAGACAAPMLLSNITGNLDIKLSPPHYYDVGNLKKLAQKLAGSYDMLKVSAEDIRQRFDWDKIAFQTAKVYALTRGGYRFGTVDNPSASTPFQ